MGVGRLARWNMGRCYRDQGCGKICSFLTFWIIQHHKCAERYIYIGSVTLND